MYKNWLKSDRPKTACGNDPLPVVGETTTVKIWIGLAEDGEPAIGHGEPYGIDGTIVEVDYEVDPSESDGNAWVDIGGYDVFVRSDHSDAWVKPEGACDPNDPLAGYLSMHGIPQ